MPVAEIAEKLGGLGDCLGAEAEHADQAGDESERSLHGLPCKLE